MNAAAVRIVRHDELFRIVDKAGIRRVIDIGCHRGAHIRDILRPSFPAAEIVGVEPKRDNFAECAKLGLPGVTFVKLDCRALGKDSVGIFDLVWCAGLVYHLDDPTQLFRSIRAITHERSYVCIEGHIAIEKEQACLTDPNPPIVAKTLDGEVYHGKVYKEFEETATVEQREAAPWASLDNAWSFWLTYDSIVGMFRKYGFEHVVELRSEAPTSPLGPGLFHPPADAKREWSRRMFLASRSPI